MGTDRLMHKQEKGGGGGINELPSYCTQVRPPTPGRKRGGDGGAEER